MRHGSAIVDEQMGFPAMQDATQELPDAQTLGQRLIAFARLAASMHAEMSAPQSHETDTDLSLSSLLGSHS